MVTYGYTLNLYPLQYGFAKLFCFKQKYSNFQTILVDMMSLYEEVLLGTGKFTMQFYTIVNIKGKFITLHYASSKDVKFSLTECVNSN